MSATYCKLTARCGTHTGVTNSFPVTFVWITPTTTAISPTVRSPVNASDTHSTHLFLSFRIIVIAVNDGRTGHLVGGFLDFS